MKLFYFTYSRDRVNILDFNYFFSPSNMFISSKLNKLQFPIPPPLSPLLFHPPFPSSLMEKRYKRTKETLTNRLKYQNRTI